MGINKRETYYGPANIPPSVRQVRQVSVVGRAVVSESQERRARRDVGDPI